MNRERSSDLSSQTHSRSGPLISSGEEKVDYFSFGRKSLSDLANAVRAAPRQKLPP